MKKLYATITLFLISFSFYGQIVNIPDANFKNRLVNTICASLSEGSLGNMDVDINNNGEIEENEAAQIQVLNLQSSHIASLEGIQYFTNLRDIYLNSNDLISLDFGNLNFLKIIQCSNNQLNSLVLGPNVTNLEAGGNHLGNIDFITGAPNLISLGLSGNGITSLDAIANVPNLRNLNVEGNSITALNLNITNIEYINCNYNSITSISASDLPSNLRTLQCNYNQLTHLSLPNTVDWLYCAHNQLTELDLSELNLWVLSVEYNQLINLEISPTSNFQDGGLYISGNLYTSINLPQHQIGSFSCQNTNLTSLEILFPDNPFDGEAYIINNNLNLRYLNLKNGTADFCPPNPEHWCYFTLTNNTALEFICVDESELENTSLLESVANANNPNVQFSSYCSFAPGGNYNTIKGNITLDMDANGCSTSDAVATYIPIKFDRLGFNLGTSFTNGNGDYTTYATYGNLTLTPQFENPYFTVTPPSYTSTFSGFENTETANFCIAPNGIHPDLEIGLIPITPSRPGFDATYRIVYKNKGTTTQSGNVSCNFNDDLLDFVSASLNPNSIQTGLLTWSYTNLAPFESREITFVLNVNSPIENPAVNPGNILTFSAHITSPATDETALDNYVDLEQVVVGSFDPNDKQVSVLTHYYELAEVENLYYTIRFQNLGTYAAENVVVADILSDILDASSLQMVSASHPYVSRYNAQTRKLEFIFEDINLPTAIDNEQGSHGYVTFKIKSLATVQIGENIENKASIFFDFNAPVMTNTTSTSIETLLKTNNYNHTVFKVYPNPVKNTLNIGVTSGINIQFISIYNPLGQLVKTLLTDEIDASLTIDVTALKTGTYFIEINSNQGKTTKKFIKL